jgi:REP element-mobilizing transposase RayT
MQSEAVYLDVKHRQAVYSAIARHCQIRQWQLFILNVRHNHVHVVVRADGVGPERVMTEMKAYSTRELRDQDLVTSGKVWTRGGSTRYINNQSSILAAIQYVKDQ